MERGFVFDEDELEWRCACGRPVTDLEFKVIYYHSLEELDATKRQFQTTGWTITSSLHCGKCGNLYVDPADYCLTFDEDGCIEMTLVEGD